MPQGEIHTSRIDYCPPAQTITTRLELDGGTTLLLVTTKLEVLAALEGELGLDLADGALETQNDLLGLLWELELTIEEKEVGRKIASARIPPVIQETHRLGLLVEDGLGLTTVTRLLAWNERGTKDAEK